MVRDTRPRAPRGGVEREPGSDRVRALRFFTVEELEASKAFHRPLKTLSVIRLVIRCIVLAVLAFSPLGISTAQLVTPSTPTGYEVFSRYPLAVAAIVILAGFPFALLEYIHLARNGVSRQRPARWLGSWLTRAALLADPPKLMARVPEAQVLYWGVRESVNLYRVRYWLTDLAVDDVTDAEVRTRVFYALQRASISLSIPAQTVFFAAQDESRAERHAERERARRIGAIARVDLLSMLADDERAQLAQRLHFAPFSRGERMTREGDADDGLYMIVEGSAAVQISTPEGPVEVARLGAGQFFGEMSLMTGEKRSATVVAATDMVTYRLDKRAFEEMIQSRPAIADAVAELLTARKEGLDAARGSADDAATRARRRQSTKLDILGRIRGFFNLGR